MHGGLKVPVLFLVRRGVIDSEELRRARMVERRFCLALDHTEPLRIRLLAFIGCGAPLIEEQEAFQPMHFSRKKRSNQTPLLSWQMYARSIFRGPPKTTLPQVELSIIRPARSMPAHNAL